MDKLEKTFTEIINRHGSTICDNFDYFETLLRKKCEQKYQSYDVDNLELTEEFLQAYNLMENSEQCLFITGKAGTGKSTLLQYFKEHSEKNGLYWHLLALQLLMLAVLLYIPSSDSHLVQSTRMKLK